MLSGDNEALFNTIRSLPWIEASSATLAELLRHDGAHFDGLSTAEAQALRGQILAAFEGRPLCAKSRAVILEELKTSISPIVLAGAARALRAAPPDPTIGHWLASSAERIALLDDYVALPLSGSERLTARSELAETLHRWATPARSCCGSGTGTLTDIAADIAPRPLRLCPTRLGAVALEDQDGRVEPLIDMLRVRPSVVCFFYTRCMNPDKCSLTVMRLGMFARHIDAVARDSWNIIGISYDPEFDTPLRLRRFGEARDFLFGDASRLARSSADWPALQSAFGLSVGYSDATVNEHAREIFLVTQDLAATKIASERLVEPAAALAFVNQI